MFTKAAALKWVIPVPLVFKPLTVHVSGDEAQRCTWHVDCLIGSWRLPRREVVARGNAGGSGRYRQPSAVAQPSGAGFGLPPVEGSGVVLDPGGSAVVHKLQMALGS